MFILNPYQSNPLINGLISYLKFNNNLTDEFSISWNTNGAGNSYGTGVFNQSAIFSGNGTIRTASVGNPLSITDSISDLPFTISIRIKVTSWPTQDVAVVVKGIYTSSPNPREYGLRIDASTKRPYFIKYSNNSLTDTVRTNSNTAISLNTWYHLVVCGNGVNEKIYLDGVEITDAIITSGTYVKMTPNTNEQVGIGNRGYVTPGAMWQLNGEVDEFCFWNRQLSPADVLRDFNRTSEIM